MFIKWSSRPKHRHDNLGALLICKLVESYRDQDRRPKHRLLKYLGSVRELMPINHRIVFWSNVSDALASLNLSSSELQDLRAKIEARVPYASPIEWQR